jgi:hypothetical protein
VNDWTAETHVIAGQMFVYREKRRLFRARSGAGQVLGEGENGGVVFVRVFDVNGSELRTRIGFIPLTRRAYDRSQAEVIKRLDLPEDWEVQLREWEAKRRVGEAGIFTGRLCEITADVLETVKYLRDVPDGGSAVIDLAYPKKSASGRYDTVAAIVRTSVNPSWV